MEGFKNYAVWAEWRNTLLQPFQTATLEFVWEEKLEITTSIFMQCIILQCVMLQYSTTYVLRDVKYSSADPDHEVIQESLRGAALQKILEMHARIISRHKFSANDIFVVYDSVFPSITKNFFLQSKIVPDPSKPIKFPIAILTPVRNNLRLFTTNAFVSSFMSVTPLLFINLNDYTISVGCFTCEPSFSKDWRRASQYRITLETPPNEFAAFENLSQFWETLHSTLNLEHLEVINCRTLPEIPSKTNFNHNLCEIYEEYFKYINCSDFMECVWLYVNNLGVRKSSMKADGLLFHFNTKIFPCGMEQIDYTLQMLFPKVQFFDANLTALLTPFTLNIWIFTLAAIAVIAIWLVFVDSDSIFSSLFQMYSSLVSQDAGNIRGKQSDSDNFPKSIEELLDGNDFHLILPISFHDEVMFVLYHWNVAELPISIATFYMKILMRSYFMKRWFYKETLETVSSGGTYDMLHYPDSVNQSCTVTDWLDSLFGLQSENVTTKKFAVLCEGQCDTQWNIALLGKPDLERIKPTQNAFFRSFKFWTIGYPSFLSFAFTKFLNPFVESGIHELVMSRYSLLEKVNLIKTSQNMVQLRMKCNFSIVSYALFANGHRYPDNEIQEKPTKIKALIGTFLVTGVMIGIAVALMMFELLNKSFLNF
ncbi:unnamed protein product [Orchesella dallaii]|uniref:Uncharacterized protein n=1 Tax=Orchesella dallaii TaxID=48710 RepID=A0ABP1RHB0_9HEXA